MARKRISVSIDAGGVRRQSDEAAPTVAPTVEVDLNLEKEALALTNHRRNNLVMLVWLSTTVESRHSREAQSISQWDHYKLLT